ncbi:hypothetical protein LY76DRAFT_166921 [Colletotrichum caudatum]|nr:hypothetical protein LY76DRAFT_166921 [Colletotrichum caudatum]
MTVERLQSRRDLVSAQQPSNPLGTSPPPLLGQSKPQGRERERMGLPAPASSRSSLMPPLRVGHPPAMSLRTRDSLPFSRIRGYGTSAASLAPSVTVRIPGVSLP